ncbi:hypothetical protein OG784_31925 [Streptomyces sp. NBC_01617]|uniref:hypothetical protein n=1 Tax=unclassified Streptomyces TaxID=2593676 RepID=UPI0038690E44|nr:hypothetical protein OG987_32075 [Streptomyces sp. NBC_01620]WTE63057.1 hypothetical protein OG784_31925 [Streptomyces sp. NBC_01617]
MEEKESARAAVREFLTTRRARVTPTDAGLPAHGTRRPPGPPPESSTPSPTSCAWTTTNAPSWTGSSPHSPLRDANAAVRRKT